jgi:hypothetical protein
MIKSLYFNQLAELFLGIGLVFSVGLLFGENEVGLWASITTQLILLDICTNYGVEKIFKKHGTAPFFLEGWTSQLTMYLFSSLICIFYYLFAQDLQVKLFAKLPENSMVIILAIFFLRVNRSIYSRLGFLMERLTRITILNCLRIIFLMTAVFLTHFFALNFEELLALLLLNEILIFIFSYILFSFFSLKLDLEFLCRAARDSGSNIGTGFSAMGGITLINLTVANVIPSTMFAYFFYSQRIYAVINLLVKPFLRRFQIKPVQARKETAIFLENQVIPVTATALLLIFACCIASMYVPTNHQDTLYFFTLGFIIFYNPYIKGLYLSAFVNQNQYVTIFIFELVELVASCLLVFWIFDESLVFLNYFFVFGCSLMGIRCIYLLRLERVSRLIASNVLILMFGYLALIFF